MATNLRAKEGGSVNQVKNEPVTQSAKPQKDLLDVFKGMRNKTPSPNPNKNKSIFGKFVDSLDASNVGGANSPFSRKGFDESKREGIAIKDDLNRLKEFSLLNALIKQGGKVAGAMKDKFNPAPKMPFASGFGEGQSRVTNIPMQSMQQGIQDPSQIPAPMTYMTRPDQQRGMTPEFGPPSARGNPGFRPNVNVQQLPSMSGRFGNIGKFFKTIAERFPGMGTMGIGMNYGGMVPNNISIEEAMEAGFDNVDDYIDFLEKQQDPAIEMGFDPLYDNDGGVVYANKGILELIMTPFDDLTEQEKELLGSFSEAELDAAAAELSRQEQMAVQGMNSGGVAYANKGNVFIPALGMTLDQYLVKKNLDNRRANAEMDAFMKSQAESKRNRMNSGGYAYNSGTPYIPDIKPMQAQNAPSMKEDTTKKELGSAAGSAVGTMVGGPIGGTIGGTIGAHLFNHGGHAGPLSLKSRVVTEKVDFN